MGNCSKHGQFSTFCRACDYDTIEKETKMTTETKHNQPHPWAEVIKAWADGMKIQYKLPNETNWEDADQSDVYHLVANTTRAEWRVKPKAKTGWIIIYNDNTLSKLIYETEERCRYMAMCANGGIAANIAAIIPITYTEGEGF